MLAQLRPAIVMIVAMTVVTGLVYPFAITGLGQMLFPRQASGSMIVRDGRIIGSELIGQTFQDVRYFHGRPSATTAADPADATKTVPAPYNAVNSSASNFAPTNKALIDRVRNDVAALQASEAAVGAVPMDLVTTSASGLDPHISVDAALYQLPRVADARKISRDRLRMLVDNQIENRLFGILGERQINVLALNIALDRLQ